MIKKKIIFFGSGDFPVPTFKKLLKNSARYEVVGLITSIYKPRVYDYSLADIADENGIDTAVVGKGNIDTPDLLEWLKMKNADIFCVISFKYLPRNILNKARMLAFNVHASILPFYKGAAPIYWTIRNKETTTGLTAFEIDNKIDCGNIIDRIVLRTISLGGNYDTIHNNLSKECSNFTKKLLDNIIGIGVRYAYPDSDLYSSTFFNVDENFIASKPSINDLSKNSIDENENTEDVERRIKAGCYEGITFNMQIKKKDGLNYKPFVFKVFDASTVTIRDRMLNDEKFLTDWKTYFYLKVDNSQRDYLSVLDIQVSGKKRMSIKDFLKGFQNYKGCDLCFQN